MGNIFIAVETENFKRYEDINFCPFCGRKVHIGYIDGVEETTQDDGTVTQTLKFKKTIRGLENMCGRREIK